MSDRTSFTTVHATTAGGVARVTIDRAPLNILDLATLAELERALRPLPSVRGVKAVVLRGAGKCFCAGVDVADHAGDRVHAMLERFGIVVRMLSALPMPVIAAVHGAALGGGLELALACDVVLLRDDAKLGQPEIKLGVFPPAAAVQLPRLIGRQRALDLVLTGRTLSAAEAFAMGIGSAVHPAAAFDDAVEQYVRQLLALSAPVLRCAKRAVLEGLEESAVLALSQAERLYERELLPLPDAHEGIAAWMEKRSPVWQER